MDNIQNQQATSQMTISHSEGLDYEAALELAKEEFGERFSSGMPFGDLTDKKLSVLYNESSSKSRLYRLYIAAFPSVLQARIVELTMNGRTVKQIMDELSCSIGHVKGTLTMASRLGILNWSQRVGRSDVHSPDNMRRLAKLRAEKRQKRLESIAKSGLASKVDTISAKARPNSLANNYMPAKPAAPKTTPAPQKQHAPATDGKIEVTLRLTPEQMAKVMAIISG